MADWDYGGAWRRHDMSGDIYLGDGCTVRVHDITHGLPEFMRAADVLFVDPPCSTGNLRSFHTKAGQDLPYSFSDFEQALFGCIDTIAPQHLFMETFRSNHAAFLARVQASWPHVRVYSSHYYDKRANRCQIIHAGRQPLPDLPIDGIDETRAIAWLCQHLPFSCIGDLCMGRGTVGKHAHLHGRRFVGTELNPKRLAVLVDFIRSRQDQETPA